MNQMKTTTFSDCFENLSLALWTDSVRSLARTWSVQAKIAVKESCITEDFVFAVLNENSVAGLLVFVPIHVPSSHYPQCVRA